MFIINNPLRPLRRRQYHTSAYSVIKGGPSPSHRSLCVTRSKRARGESWKEKRARGCGQASLLSPTRGIGFSLPKVFRALYLFDNSFSFLEYHGQPLRKRESQARTIFSKIQKKQTNKQMLQGREGYHAEMMNINPF